MGLTASLSRRAKRTNGPKNISPFSCRFGRTPFDVWAESQCESDPNGSQAEFIG